jgi:hypothetical protein
VTKRQDDVAALGAVVVLVAYDNPGLLAAKAMKGLDVPFTLAFDPERVEYRRWGLGRTNLLGAMLSPELNWRYLKLLAKGERFLGFAPDMFQLGADFVLDRDHRVAFVHRMRNNGDRAAVPLLFEELERAGRRGGGT